MYLRVTTIDGERVYVAEDELGIFKEMKSLAFVSSTQTLEEYLEQLTQTAWTFYRKGVHLTGETLEEKAKSAYRQFKEFGFLTEISKEEALEHFGLSQKDADKMEIAGLRVSDK